MGAIEMGISAELFKEVFGFPDDVKIHSANFDKHRGTIKMVLIGPDFPAVEFGADPYPVTPIYETETQRIYRLKDWGLPKKEQKYNED